MTKYTYLIPVLGVLMLVPTATFAATSVPTSNEQYVSFLRQEIAELEAELVQLQATSTPPTSPSTQLDEIGTVAPVATTTKPVPSACIEWKQNYLGAYCTTWSL